MNYLSILLAQNTAKYILGSSSGSKKKKKLGTMKNISVGTGEQKNSQTAALLCPPKLSGEFLNSCVFSSRHLCLDRGTADAIAARSSQGSTALFSNLCYSFQSFLLAFDHLCP